MCKLLLISREGGLIQKIYKLRLRGKLIEFNEQFLAKSTKLCLKLCFNKNHNILKNFAEILFKSLYSLYHDTKWISKETFLRKISSFSPKNFLCDFLLNFLKNKGGKFLPWRFFIRKFFQRGLHPTCTHLLRNPGNIFYKYLLKELFS